MKFSGLVQKHVIEKRKHKRNQKKKIFLARFDPCFRKILNTKNFAHMFELRSTVFTEGLLLDGIL